MSDDPRRTGMCTPTCYRVCQCSRWPDMLDRWGNPVNHGSGGEPEPVIWWLEGGIAAADCLAAYTSIGAASLAASYDNNAAPGNGLADGTYDAAPGVAPGWAAGTGRTYDGATQFLLTGIPGNTKPFTAIARMNLTNVVATRTILGPGGAFNTLEWIVNVLGRQQLLWAGAASMGTSTTVVPLGTSHVLAISYSGIGAWQFYLDGVPDGNGVTDWGLLPGQLAIGVDNAIPQWWWLGSEQALSFYDTVLTDAQVLAVSTAAAAL